MENNSEECHAAAAADDASAEAFSEGLELMAALESQHSTPQLVRKVAAILKEWKHSAYGVNKRAVYINVRDSARAKGEIKTNVGQLKKHIADGHVNSLLVSITVPDNPTAALADAFKALAQAAQAWTGITKFELEVALTEDSALEMSRSLHRYRDSLAPVAKSITALVPGPLEFVASDRSACVVVGQLFDELAAFYSLGAAANAPEGASGAAASGGRGAE
ncbi:hypothetical protein H4R19_001671 [Coemansia spiralis]|nr:hypothetical protein H4R19_001671 [Coemansia spiralis]